MRQTALFVALAVIFLALAGTELSQGRRLYAAGFAMVAGVYLVGLATKVLRARRDRAEPQP